MESMNEVNRDDTGAAARYVFLDRTRCPLCGAAELQTLRSVTDGEGVTTRRTRCRKCDHRFFVVIE